MPNSIFMLNGWTGSDFYENAEIRLVHKDWYSSAPYGDATAYVLPSGDYRAVITIPGGATYTACSTRRGKIPSVLFQNVDTGETVRLKTTARMRRAWEKLLRQAEWTNGNHICDQIEAGTYKRPYPEYLNEERSQVAQLQRAAAESELALQDVIPFPANREETRIV